MRQLESCLPVNKRALRSLPADGPSPPMQPDDVIDALWIGMADVYGFKWTSAVGADPATGAGATWAVGLAGLAPEQVGAGVDACIASSEAWPPSLPEFRAMCLGIPHLAAVRFELHEQGATRTPFTALVWQGIDGYAFRLASREHADRMIRDAYELAREHVMRGGALPDMPAAAITHDVRKPVPAKPEVAEAAIKTAREILAGAEPQPVADASPAREVPLAAVEAELVRHYGRDGKAAAAGADS